MSYMNSLTLLFERNQDATIYVGNLDQKVSDEIVWELFTQCGTVINVYMPKDKISSDHQGFAFVEFRSEEDAEYAIKIMHMVKLYGKPIKVNKATQDKRTQEVGANLFVGNLSEEVDEKTLKDIFSAFGMVLSTKIMRDPESGLSKHYGFVSFDNFDSSDEAIKKMNGQYISGKPIEIEYAFKKDTKGEKHGSVAERIIAANKPINLVVGDFQKNDSLSSVRNLIQPSINYSQLNMKANGNNPIANQNSQSQSNSNVKIIASTGIRPPSFPPKFTHN